MLNAGLGISSGRRKKLMSPTWRLGEGCNCLRHHCSSLSSSEQGLRFKPILFCGGHAISTSYYIAVKSPFPDVLLYRVNYSVCKDAKGEENIQTQWIKTNGLIISDIIARNSCTDFVGANLAMRSKYGNRMQITIISKLNCL